MSKVGSFFNRVNTGVNQNTAAKRKERAELKKLAVDAGMTYATRGTNKIGSGAAPKKAKGGEAKKDDKFIQKAVAEMEKKGTKGAFTKKANRRDMSVKQFTNEVLDNPSEYDLKTRRQAQFVKNVTKYEWGGKVDTGVGVSDTLNKAYEYAKGGIVYKITDIKYDTNDASDLPKTLKIEVPKGYEGYEADEFISDKISDETGFTHKGFNTTPKIKYAKGGTVLTKEYKDYLDELRDSGETNMFGAGRYLQAEFGLDKSEAREVLSKWMKSFDKGGTMKKQGYNDKLDESLSMRKGKASTKKQSSKDRRDESKGMEKSMGRRAYASVGTMDKDDRMMAKGGTLYGDGKMYKYSSDGYVKEVRDVNGKLLKEITNKGKKYRRNSTYKTYNSVDGNELLHQSQIGNKMAKGGKTQGYNDKLDESLGNRKGKESTKKQSLKDRRDESKGEEKSLGKRAYSSVSSMDKLLPFLSWHKK